MPVAGDPRHVEPAGQRAEGLPVATEQLVEQIGGIGEYENSVRMAYVRGPEVGLLSSLHRGAKGRQDRARAEAEAKARAEGRPAQEIRAAGESAARRKRRVMLSGFGGGGGS
jgi:hypothetical protein